MGLGAFDVRGPELATQLINKFAGALGTSVLTRSVPQTYNPLDGTQSAPVTTTDEVDVSPPQKAEASMVNDTILSTDYYTFIAASEYTLDDADLMHVTLTYNSGLQYRLIWFDRIYSGANIAAYTAFWRKI